MATVSLCMIVKNEEDVLARCLESAAAAADEVIIADTGSADGTKAIAASFGARVYDFEWIDDFSAARNFVFSKAAMDYVMWLDADDVLPPETAEGVIALKKSLDAEVDIVAMKYVTHFDDNGAPAFISTRERLVRREKNPRWEGAVHECIPLIGNVMYTDLEVHHKKPPGRGISDRNIKIYEKIIKGGGALTPRERYYYARELKDHGRFAEAAQRFEAFLAEGKGWAEDNIAACHCAALCRKALGESRKALAALFKSFEYDAPRAEIVCEIAYYYKAAGRPETALKWFEIAAGLGAPDGAGFVARDYWGYIPNLEICVLLCEAGDYAAAREYNERAGRYKPGDAAVAHNRAFLSGKLGAPRADAGR